MSTTGQDPIAGRYSVTATYHGLEEAREAVEALEEKGVAASAIRLSGETAERARRATSTEVRDSHVMSVAGRAVAIGSLVGAAGAALVAAVGALLLGFTGVALIGAAVAGAMAGSFFGAILGFIVRVKQSEAWELTHQPVGDNYAPVGVTVVTDHEDEVERAEEALRETGPAHLRRTA